MQHAGKPGDSCPRLSPKLGSLRHHPPKPLKVPRWYRKTPATLKSSPRISIVTPCLNNARFLEATIQSVLGQHYPDLEYIVQDGGSSDGCASILQRYAPRLSHCESRRDAGQANALNLGFRHATGEIMAYLNADDLLLPGALHYVAGFFSRRPEVDVVYGHRILIDESGQDVGRWVLPGHDDEILSWSDFIPQETVFWRRRIWERVGGRMDESFRFALDWDLLLRFRAAGAKFVRLPRFLAAFRVHADQKTSAQMTGIGTREMDRLRERCHGRPVSPAEVALHTREYLRKHLVCDLLYRLDVFRY
jgi:glycosyltransferase involved in cell wall biosynthesis